MTGTQYHLLVIEDNEADIYLIRRALKDLPADLTVCSDRDTAVAALEKTKDDQPDAIILDLALPQVEGLDLLRNILSRPAFAGTPVMVFTSSPSPTDKRRVEMLGGVRYVPKPSDLKTFLKAVSENVKGMLDNRGMRVYHQAQ